MELTFQTKIVPVCASCGRDLKVTAINSDEVYITPCRCVEQEVEDITEARIAKQLKPLLGLLILTLPVEETDEALSV